MSLSDLQELYLPKRTSRSLQRELKDSRKALQKYTRSRIRRLKSKVNATMRRQYFMSDAYTDLKIATKRNEDVMIASLMAISVLSLSLYPTAVNTLFIFLETAYEISDITGLSITFLMLLVAGIVGVICGWLFAFLLNLLSISVMDGLTLKPQRSVRLTARRALRYTSRVALAWLAFATVLLMPLIALSALFLAYIQLSNTDLLGVIALLPYGIILGSSWIIAMLLNYGLQPHVALFEPTLALHKTFGRSRQLLQRRGRLFLLATYTLAAVAGTSLYVISHLIETAANLNQWFIFSVGMLTILLSVNAITAVLYRKRKLARVN